MRLPKKSGTCLSLGNHQVSFLLCLSRKAPKQLKSGEHIFLIFWWTKMCSSVRMCQQSNFSSEAFNVYTFPRCSTKFIDIKVCDVWTCLCSSYKMTAECFGVGVGVHVLSSTQSWPKLLCLGVFLHAFLQLPPTYPKSGPSKLPNRKAE